MTATSLQSLLPTGPAAIGLALFGLLLAQTLLGWALARGLGLDEARNHQLSRLSMHLLVSVLLLALVAALMSVPLDNLLRERSMSAALIFSAALLLPLLVLSRTWPLFALPLIGDTAAMACPPRWPCCWRQRRCCCWCFDRNCCRSIIVDWPPCWLSPSCCRSHS